MGHWANSEQHERKWHLLFISQLCRAQQCVWLGLLLCVKRVACFPWGEYQLISSDTEEKLPENTLLWGPTKHCGFLTIFQYGGVLPRLIAWLAHLLYHMYSLRSAFGLELEWRENKGIGPTTEQSRSCGEKSIWQILWLGSKSLFILSCHRCLITRILQDRKKKISGIFTGNSSILRQYRSVTGGGLFSASQLNLRLGEMEYIPSLCTGRGIFQSLLRSLTLFAQCRNMFGCGGYPGKVDPVMLCSGQNLTAHK